MITTENGFEFTLENGLVAKAPKGSQVYVHVTDNGNGTHAVNGKVVLTTENGASELGWIRTNETLKSNTNELLAEASLLVKTELEQLNPGVTFLIQL